MSAAIRLAGLALIAVAAIVLSQADKATLQAIGAAFLLCLASTGFLLCVGAGMITPAARREVDAALVHAEDLEDKN